VLEKQEMFGILEYPNPSIISTDPGYSSRVNQGGQLTRFVS
jgi:hypothetical protein